MRSQHAADVAAAMDIHLMPRGFRRLDSEFDRLTYAQLPIEQIVVTASFGIDQRDKVGVQLGVDPLVGPEPSVLAVPSEGGRSIELLERSWSLFELRTHGEAIASAIRIAADKARATYGTPERFIAEVDDEYLYDDVPSLAEAVAYLHVRQGNAARAMYHLQNLADDELITDAMSSRASRMLVLIRTDPIAAIEQVDNWGRLRLASLGLL